MTRPVGRGRGDRGVAVVEFALVFPLAMLFMLGAVQCALWWYAQSAATAAAEHGTSIGRVDDATVPDAETAARRFIASAGGLKDASVTATRGANTVTVEVRGRSPVFMPVGSWEVYARSDAPIERFVPRAER
jgi:Flp pilus assembly protein TadG